MRNHEECLVDAILDKKFENATPNFTLKTKKLNGANGGQRMFNAKINHADEAAGKGLKVTITDKGPRSGNLGRPHRLGSICWSQQLTWVTGDFY